MSLDQLEESHSACIEGYGDDIIPDFKRRLQDLGFSQGENVTCLKKAPFGGPNVYKVGGAVFSLDRKLAKQVWLK